VICTDSGGPGEFVRHGETGLVVPVDDVDAVAQAIDSLLADDARRHDMSEAARRHAASTHAYPRMVQEILEIYAAASASARAMPSAARSRPIADCHVRTRGR
jgi:glycosyltransferase involved in cell wall biosynthesis